MDEWMKSQNKLRESVKAVRKYWKFFWEGFVEKTFTHDVKWAMTN